MQHNVTVIATAVGTDVDTGPYADAITDPDGGTDVINITDADVVAVVTDVGPALGIGLEGLTLEPGDTIVVTGAVGRIPDYQVGAMFTVDVDGKAHFVNAGAIAQAISAIP